MRARAVTNRRRPPTARCRRLTAHRVRCIARPNLANTIRARRTNARCAARAKAPWPPCSRCCRTTASCQSPSPRFPILASLRASLPARENIVSRRDSPDPHRRAHKRRCSGSKAVVCLLAKSVVVRGGRCEVVESRGSPERAALGSRRRALPSSRLTMPVSADVSLIHRAPSSPAPRSVRAIHRPT